MHDKRRAFRLPLEIPASFKFFEAQKHISIGTTLNVSALGICLTTKERLERGQRLTIKLKLPTGEEVAIHTTVIWITGVPSFEEKIYKVGIKIIDELKPDEAKFIKYYVKEFLRVSPELSDGLRDD